MFNSIFKHTLPSGQNRNIGLDWLRGLCALSIMFYHYFGMNQQYPVLSKLGIYGVSIFFILSGLSMAIVYNSFMKDVKSILNFYLRRLFRIAPLHLIVCSLIVINIIYVSGVVDWGKYFLNISLLFSFVSHDKYMAMGAWSIGNEMVYYCFTPFIIMLYNYKKKLGNLFCIVTLIIGGLFAFHFLNPSVPLAKQWSVYINPFNNLFLYVSGIAIFYNLSSVKISNKIGVPALLLVAIVFAIIPFKDPISIVTGYLRVIYCILSVLFVVFFYKVTVNNVTIIGKLFEQFGIATYGVYILHPVVLGYLKYVAPTHFLLMISSAVVTIIIALLSYYTIEIKLIKLGKIIRFV
jgi:peptidoglycan/LPS O-acetylase OafA/YrhL